MRQNIYSSVKQQRLVTFWEMCLFFVFLASDDISANSFCMCSVKRNIMFPSKHWQCDSGPACQIHENLKINGIQLLFSSSFSPVTQNVLESQQRKKFLGQVPVGLGFSHSHRTASGSFGVILTYILSDKVRRFKAMPNIKEPPCCVNA